MKTALSWLALALALGGCGPFQYRTSMPRPPVCVVGGMQPAEQSMNEYGATYTAGMNGPAPATPESHLVPADQVGSECVAPPWWAPPE